MKIVLGGGISGLSAAYYLRKRFPNEIIQLYESSSRVGGWIKSKKLPNGAIFEQGPRTLRPTGPAGYNTLELIDELKLASSVISIKSSDPASKNRMIYVNGKLHTLPSSILDLFKKKPPFNKSLFRHLMHDFGAEKRDGIEDESIYDFVERRFGKDIADYAISPLICGICAGDAKQISVKFLMKGLFEKEQIYGSVIKGAIYDMWKSKDNKKPNNTVPTTFLAQKALREKWSIYSLQNGLQTLVNELVTKLNENSVNILLNKTCEKLELYENYLLIKVNGFVEYLPNHAVSCLPAKKLAKLIEEQHPELATYLREIPTVTVAVVNLYYSKKLSLQKAFGFLVPPMENLPILGVIYDSCCFPTDGTVLTVMMGGHWFEKYFGDAPREYHLYNTAAQQLRNILSITETPDYHKVNLLRNCIPQYTIGHEDRIKKIENYIKVKKLPLTICGSSYYGIGVNDVIYNARLAVDKI